jgi:hypothetical protein
LCLIGVFKELAYIVILLQVRQVALSWAPG